MQGHYICLRQASKKWGVVKNSCTSLKGQWVHRQYCMRHLNPSDINVILGSKSTVQPTATSNITTVLNKEAEWQIQEKGNWRMQKIVQMFTILTHIRVQLLLCLYSSLWYWAPLGTTTVANRMTIDNLIVAKNHKLKPSYTPVTVYKHLCRSTQFNISSSAPCTHNSGKHWHLRACRHPLTHTKNKSQPQCTNTFWRQQNGIVKCS